MNGEAALAPRRRGAVATAATFVLVVVSAGLMLAAMVAYPGGSAFRPREAGFDFVANYFCDLIRPVAHNGVANGTGMVLGQLAMVTTGLASLPAFLVAPRWFPAHPFARRCRPLGIAAIVLLPAVPLTPSNVAGSWHAVAILAAGTPGCAALVLVTLGIASVRARFRVLFRVSVVMLLAAGVTALLYAATLAFGLEGIALAASQKIAWLALVAWQLAIAARITPD